jgi:hypothetical protein
MPASLGADLVVVIHFVFIVFVVAGGLLVLRHPRLAWVHVPVVGWGAGIELVGGICPLTPLENALRRAAGEAGYHGGFIEHYLLPLIYPAGLTPEIGIVLGVGVLLVNGVVYALLWRRRRGGRAARRR